VSTLDGAGKTAKPSSYISYQNTIEGPPEDIQNIASLLKALRRATVDREKIDHVKEFVNEGGEELVYLKDHIADIMSFLVFQNSRRQLLTYLKETANEARKHRQWHEKDHKPESDVESRRTDNLLAAVDAANSQIGDLEFWSDRKHVLKTADDESLETRAISTIFDQPAPKPRAHDDPVKEIKGLPKAAEIGNPTTRLINRPRQEPEKEKGSDKNEDKGKSRARDSEDDAVEEEPSPRLKTDELLIRDDD
jgi:hypothetical protein